jgi:hypothetical protein
MSTSVIDFAAEPIAISRRLADLPDRVVETTTKHFVIRRPATATEDPRS